MEDGHAALPALPPLCPPQEAGQRILDMLTVSAFLLAADCTILGANAAGWALLRQSPAFFAQNGRLAIRRAPDAAALAEAVQRAARLGEPELLHFLTRQEEASALMRIDPVEAPPGSVACGITELRAPLLLAPGWSRAAFGFSPQNAALAESLAIGRSLADFAEEHALPIGTVRTRLKKLLLQTGTSSQMQLAALVLRASMLMKGREDRLPARKPRKPSAG
ncbi:helix-turn-helix transcriptional regulator [Acidisoma sp. C75]